MQGVYNAHISVTGVTAAKTFLVLTAPATAVLEILSAGITNEDNDTGEQIVCELARITDTVPAAWNSGITPVKMEALSAASSATVSGDATSEPTYAASPIDNQGVNNLAGYEFMPTPEERPIIAPSASVGLRITAAPASTGFSAWIRYREIG